MDHSGSINRLLEVSSGAKVITSPNGKKGLVSHFKEDWDFQVVSSGDSLTLGERTLRFALTPMVHWPDSMVTYVPEEKLLLPNDAFGQHIATSERFDDEIGKAILMEEAAKYYGNIVLPYGEQVKKALEAVAGLDIEMIGPSHGLIWRTHIVEIVEAYRKWAAHETERRAVIVYDTMWGSTEKIAHRLCESLERESVPVTMRSLKATHISDIMTDVVSSKAVLIGSPTLNNGLLPSVGAFLTYVKGLRPRNRIGFAFGSYGWGGQAVKEIEEVMATLSWSLPVPSLNLKWIPDEPEYGNARLKGTQLARVIKES
jgi:flavorubredoxin